MLISVMLVKELLTKNEKEGCERMRIVNLLYSLIQSDVIVAKVSSYLSHREINNVSHTERPHYFSSTKGVTFLEAIESEVPTKRTVSLKERLGYNKRFNAGVEGCEEESYKINLYKYVKKNIRVAERKKIIVPYEKSRRGKYVLIHMPLFSGTMMLKTCKKYEDIYWWCGEYRDLKVYACGNKKNRIDDAEAIDNPLWDPSGSDSSCEFFDKINDYVLEDSEEYIDVNQKDFFEKLSRNLHKGTMRGCKENPYQGWCVMLLRCDYVGKENGCTKIFGSPVFVSYETEPGYGWYYVGDDKGKEYYLENCGNRGAHCLISTYPLFDLLIRSFSVGNKMYEGYNYGYYIFEESKCRRLCIRRDVILASREERKQIIAKGTCEDVINGIEGVRAVCLTTKLIIKKSRKR